MINKALKIVRQFHKTKQSDLADKLSISKSYLSEIESGKKPVSFDLLEKYADIFEIPVSSLVFFSENIDKEGKTAKRFRVAVTGKILKVMEWLSEKDEHETQEA